MVDPAFCGLALVSWSAEASYALRPTHERMWPSAWLPHECLLSFRTLDQAADHHQGVVMSVVPARGKGGTGALGHPSAVRRKPRHRDFLDTAAAHAQLVCLLHRLGGTWVVSNTGSTLHGTLQAFLSTEQA